MMYHKSKIPFDKKRVFSALEKSVLFRVILAVSLFVNMVLFVLFIVGEVTR